MVFVPFARLKPAGGSEGLQRPCLPCELSGELEAGLPCLLLCLFKEGPVCWFVTTELRSGTLGAASARLVRPEQTDSNPGDLEAPWSFLPKFITVSVPC